MIRVTAQAPTRIDLAGGTLDLWPIHQLLDQKVTVNVGVTLDCQVDILASTDGKYHVKSQDQNLSVSGDFASVCENTKLPLLGRLIKAVWKASLPPISIITAAKSPAGAGLGGSSCLAVTLSAALAKARAQAGDTDYALNEFQLAQTAGDVEAKIIHAPTGIQDYWGALRGRVNVLQFPPGALQITTYAPDLIKGLEDQLILCFSGKSRASAINNWEIFKRIFDGDKELLATFNEIGAIAERCGEAVADGNLSRVLLLSGLEWQLRCKLWPAVESEETKRLNAAARKAGALFSRVCGAGGGGVMAVFAEPDVKQKVCEALTANGGLILRASVAHQGLQVR